MKKQFVICDRDERYLHRVQDYLIKKGLCDFQIVVYHQIQEAVVHSQDRPFEVVLLGENICNETIQEIKAKQIFILKESQKAFTYPYPCLDKYQPMEQLLKQILETYTSDFGFSMTPNRGKKAKLITFFSVHHSYLQTLHAIASGQILAKENRKVLYLNLQPFAGLEEIVGMQDTQDLTDFIYYALQHSEKLGSKIDYMKRQVGGLNCLPTVQDYTDLLSMTKEEWQDFVQVLLFETGYEIILMDIAGVSFGVEEILQNSDLIYYLEGMEKQDKASIHQFEKLLEKKDWEDRKENMRKITVSGKVETPFAAYDSLSVSYYGESMKHQLREDGVVYYG